MVLRHSGANHSKRFPRSEANGPVNHRSEIGVQSLGPAELRPSLRRSFTIVSAAVSSMIWKRLKSLRRHGLQQSPARTLPVLQPQFAKKFL
jgi:hypothetical protein